MLNLIFTFLTFNGQNNEFGEHEPLSKLHESASIEQPPSSNGHPFASFGALSETRNDGDESNRDDQSTCYCLHVIEMFEIAY